jgi:hypothetical protein
MSNSKKPEQKFIVKLEDLAKEYFWLNDEPTVKGFVQWVKNREGYSATRNTTDTGNAAADTSHDGSGDANL